MYYVFAKRKDKKKIQINRNKKILNCTLYRDTEYRKGLQIIAFQIVDVFVISRHFICFELFFAIS